MSDGATEGEHGTKRRLQDTSPSIDLCGTGTGEILRRNRVDSSNVNFKVGHVRLIHDSIQRAAIATRQLENIARTFSGQFANETRVLSKAKEVLGAFLKHADNS